MKKGFSLVLLLIGFCFSQNVSAQPELDPAYASGLVQFGAIGGAYSALFQPDNKVILVGPCNHVSVGLRAIFCTVRLNEAGFLDSLYGTNGYTVTLASGVVSPRDAVGAALQSDGKIVALGYEPVSGQQQMILIRLNDTGILDSSFGAGGIVKLSAGGETRPGGIAIQPDGKILVVGHLGTVSPFTQFVARLNSNGSFDTSFGNNGIVTIMPPGFTSTTGLSIALRQDGKIITGGGAAGTGSPSSLMITRLNKDGSLDTTFDDDGYRTEPYGAGGSGFFGFKAVRLQSDGRIMGLSHTNMLYRFNINGSLDTSFDGDGLRPALNAASLLATSFTVSASGKITAAGYPPTQAPIDYRIARYTPDGAPDTSFSGDGFLEIHLFGQDAAVMTDTDLKGRTHISGYSAMGTVHAPFENSQFSNARLSAAPAQNVGISGRVTGPGGRAILNAALTLRNGAEIIGSARTNSFGWFHISNVAANQTYTLSTSAKARSFSDLRVTVDGQITNLLVIGE